MGEGWKCPYCNSYNLVDRNSTINEVDLVNTVGWGEQLKGSYYNKEDKMLSLRIKCVVCLNPKCKNYTIEAMLFLDNPDDSLNVEDDFRDPTICIQTWNLLPDGLAKIFPDYIPKVILDDYKEAYLIKDKSSKAFATLARRCFKG